MLSSWVPHWVVGDYVGEDDDHSYEDYDDNYEEDDDSYKDDDDSYEDDDDVAVYSSLGLVGKFCQQVSSDLGKWLEWGKEIAGLHQIRNEAKYGNTEWGEGITALTQSRN